MRLCLRRCRYKEDLRYRMDGDSSQEDHEELLEQAEEATMALRCRTLLAVGSVGVVWKPHQQVRLVCKKMVLELDLGGRN